MDRVHHIFRYLYYILFLVFGLSTLYAFLKLDVLLSIYHLIALLFLWVSAKRYPLGKFLPKESYLHSFKSGTDTLKSLSYLLLSLFFMLFMIEGLSLPMTLFTLLAVSLGFWLLVKSIPQNPHQIDTEEMQPSHQLEAITNEIPKLHDKPLQTLLYEILQKGSKLIAYIEKHPHSSQKLKLFFVEHIDGLIGLLKAYNAIESQQLKNQQKQQLYKLINDVNNRFSTKVNRLTTGKA
jgi:hypothetical protein